MTKYTNGTDASSLYFLEVDGDKLSYGEIESSCAKQNEGECVDAFLVGSGRTTRRHLDAISIAILIAILIVILVQRRKYMEHLTL
jgi:hypothetical protein